MGQQSSPWQKLVRGAIKELINEVNSSQPKKTKPKKTKRKKVIKTKKRSRSIPTSVRVDVLKKDNCRCVFCGATAQETQLQIDHIIPFSKGGSNDLSNLQTLCRECNRGKSDRVFRNY
jgi:5-methylcytosine-specific restriction enzyme A